MLEELAGLAGLDFESPALISIWDQLATAAETLADVEAAATALRSCAPPCERVLPGSSPVLFSRDRYGLAVEHAAALRELSGPRGSDVDVT